MKLSQDYWAQRVRELARTEAYHRGIHMRFEHVAQHLPEALRPRFIAEQMELAGFPVWTSVPDEALF